jgi:CRISPR-associated protein Csm1
MNEMQIGHIFNEVKTTNKKSFIDTQPFEVEYWKRESDYKIRDDVNDDFSKKYYHSLAPIDNKSVISKYDDEKLKALTDDLGNDLLLISGDFWGIQKFIFDGLTSSKASKILRSRSAMVQLITYAVVDRIKQEFKGGEALLFGAGKFMILAKNENLDKIKTIQEELDSYFLENFFGQNGFIISTATTTADKLLNQKDMKSDLDALGADNDDKKLNKFDLLNCADEEILQDPFTQAQKDDAICEFCSKRIKTYTIDDTQACGVCFNEIELGKKLTKKSYVTIFSSDKKLSKENIKIIEFDSVTYYAKFEDTVSTEGDSFDINMKEGYFDYPKWSLNSYVPKDEFGEIKDFSTLSENSSGLMALKADIDKLGDTFRDLYKEDFKKFNRLSREVEFFFSDYITSLVAKRDNVYTVFAGGDDLFLIGEYKEIVSLSKEIRDEFYKFALEKTTISMGLVMFKPSTPITFVSKMADEAEKRAKSITVDGKDRNGIDIFGVSMKYDEFIEIEENFKRVTNFLEKESDDKTALYYRLIELCDMRENINVDVRNAMWKSKLNYLFKRNVKREDNNSEIFTILSNLIEKGEKFKPSLFFQIYKNRDKKKEK